MHPALIVIGTTVAIVLGASVALFGRERSVWTFFKLLGASFLIVVVLAHVAEAARLLPCMGWGLPGSPGHYVDLVSIIAGLALFATGYVCRRLTRAKRA
jgi:hypothetical protein